MKSGNTEEIIPELKTEIIGFVSLFNSSSTFEGYLMPNPSLLKNSSGTI